MAPLPLLVVLLAAATCWIANAQGGFQQGRFKWWQEAGASIHFDGIDDFATVFPNFNLLTDWTIELFVKPSAPLRTGRCLFSLHAFSMKNLITLASTQDRVWQVYYGPEAEPIPWRGIVNSSKSSSFVVGQHHIALTHQVISSQQSKLQLYLNATLYAEWRPYGSAMFSKTEPQLPFILGACHTQIVGGLRQQPGGISRTNFFQGHMEEVRLWQGVRTFAEIEATKNWCGPPERWPKKTIVSASQGFTRGIYEVDFNIETLMVHHSFDVLTGRLHDSSGNGQIGWLGTRGSLQDSPRYTMSEFGANKEYGSLYFEWRQNDAQTSIDFRAMLLLDPAVEYNAFMVLKSPSHEPDVILFQGQRDEYGNFSTLHAQDMSQDPYFFIFATKTVDFDNFIVQPCRGISTQKPRREGCVGEKLYEVGFTVVKSSPPVAGRLYSLQLLKSNAFVELPGVLPPNSSSIEMWIQFTPPLAHDATILSVHGRQGTAPGNEAFRLALSHDAKTGVLLFCVKRQDEAFKVSVPGLAIAEAQHLALTFHHQMEADGEWKYSVNVFQNCVLLMTASIPEPCFDLSSADDVFSPVIGQRFVVSATNTGADMVGVDNAGMHVGEIRVWGVVRSQEQICESMIERLEGGEPGLVGYFPVLQSDIRSITSKGDATLENAIYRDLDLAPAPASARVVCVSSELAELCPNFAHGIGYGFRPHNFPLPPEEMTADTLATMAVEIELDAHDPDNYDDFKEFPRELDRIAFEILEFPKRSCGRLYKTRGEEKGERIPDAAERLRDGSEPTEVLVPVDLPLLFVPFENVPVDLQTATCSTRVVYRAIDSMGLESIRNSTVVINVKRPGPTLLVVDAFDTGVDDEGMDDGDVLRFIFDTPTTGAQVLNGYQSPDSLIEVQDGTFGTAKVHSSWDPEGRFLLLQLSDVAGSGIVLEPGVTSFRMSGDVVAVRRKYDDFTMPCNGTSGPLQGSFSKAICTAGYIFDIHTARCEPCPRGTMWSPNGLECEPCPLGTFSDKPHSLMCMPCINGTYMPVDFAGARTRCVKAPLGSYSPFQGSTRTMKCPGFSVAEREGMSECKVCPPKANCESPEYFRTKAVPQAGYFRAALGDFNDCRVPGACPGGFLKCTEGSMNPSLGCYPCASGWTRDAAWRDKMPCRECVDPASTISRILLVFFGAAALCAYMGHLSIYAARHPMYLHLYLLKIGLGYMTSMNVLTTVEEWELEEKFGDLAGMARSLLSLFSWDGSLPLQLVDIDCLFQGDSTDGGHIQGLLLFWSMLPLIFSAFVFLLFFSMFEILGFLKNKDQATSVPSSSSVVPIADQPSHPAIQDQPEALGAIVPAPKEPNSAVTATKKRWGANRTYTSSFLKRGYTQAVIEKITKPKPRRTKDDTQKNLSDLLHEERILGIWRKSAMELQFNQRLGVFAEDSSSVMLVALVLVYPCVIKHLVQFLRCDVLEGAKAPDQRLLLAPDKICWTGDHLAILFPCILFIVLWGFGVPIALFFFPWQNRTRLAEVRTKCLIGYLTNGYEPRFYYWETINLLRRLCLFLAGVAPSVPRVYMFAVWTTLGLLFAVLHALLEPYDNRSTVLDSLEQNHHMLFFGSAGALLFILKMTLAAPLNFLILLVLVALNILFVGRMAVIYMAQIRRQVSDSWVEIQKAKQRTARLNIGSANPKFIKKNSGILNFIKTRIFLLELEVQSSNAQVQFSIRNEELMCSPGKSSTGKPAKEVQEFERQLISQGLADGLHHAVVDSNLERLPCLYLEYLIRQTFVWRADKNRSQLEAMKELKASGMAPDLVVAQEKRLSALSTPVAANGAGLSIQPRNLLDEQSSDEQADATNPFVAMQVALSLPAKAQKLKERAAFEPFFDARNFTLGMSTCDFKAEMSRVTESSTNKLKEDLHGFMVRKGVIADGDKVNPRQLLKSHQQSPEAAQMKVEDLEHPGDNARMLTMTPKATTPPEGWGVGLGDTIHPSAMREPQEVPLGPPREFLPPGNVQTRVATGHPPSRVIPKNAPALPPPPPPPQY